MQDKPLNISLYMKSDKKANDFSKYVKKFWREVQK